MQELKYTWDSELYRTLRSHYINRDPFLVYESEEDPALKFSLWLAELGVRVEFSERPNFFDALDAVGMHPKDIFWVTPNPELTLLLLSNDLVYQRV